MGMAFGIVGAGMISRVHGDALTKSTKADLGAVCDISEERATKLQQEFNPNAKIYTDLKAMLADPEIKGVAIVTPNHLHKDAVIASANAGKHVLCEKPPAMSLADTDEMMAACAKAGVKFGIFTQCRVRKPVQAMKQAIAEGRFGKILRAEAIMKWFRSSEYYKMDAWRSERKSGAGVTIQHAFHYIDLIQYLMGPAAAVEARMRNLNHPDVALEDTLDAVIEFKNGAMGTVQASTGLWPGSNPKIEIYGTDGTAIMDGAAFSMWQFKEERPEDDAIRNSGDAAQKAAGSDPTALDSIDHQVVYDDCVDAIAAKREVIIPCACVKNTLEMALAMYQSDKEKARIELPLVDESLIW